MSNPLFCPKCKKGLTGAIEMVSTTIGNFVYIVPRETNECNWRRCKGCKNVVCKKCDDQQRLYCCDEGRIVARERAAAALNQQEARTDHAFTEPIA